MLRNYRESLAEQLRDANFRNDLAEVVLEQDGLRMRLDEVARADAINESQGYVTPGRSAKDSATTGAAVAYAPGVSVLW